MLTILCPVFNEEKYIDELLGFFSTSLPKEKELYIIDGGSTDSTVEIVKNWQKSFNNIKLLSNPDKYVPFALNLGVRSSTGDPIIRLDAHTRYSKDYFIKILQTFEETGADIVGGPMNAVGDSDFQKAVAYTTSTRFGIGDSKIHDIKFKGYSDHVYLGSWRRSLFEDIGFFDERLKRNQDDEFHYRAKSMGKVIYCNPEIKSYYFPRSGFSSLFLQYFQYGEFKPLVMKKVQSEVKLRHLIPGLFVLYLFSFPLWGIIHFLSIPAAIYLIINFWFSFKNHYNYKIKLLAFLIYPVLHIAYGSGTIYGLITYNAKKAPERKKLN